MTRQRSTQQLLIRCRQRTCGLRWDETILLVLGGALWLVVTPASAHAEGCGPRDLAACVNAAQYAFWHGVAGELWSVNRVFLTLAYQLDVFRAWLIETVFTSVFATVKDVISPALAPMATLAVLVGVLCFLLMPLIGRVEVVNIRRALIWIVVAPLLLGIAGQGLASAEQFRTTLGQTMFAAAQAIGSVPRLGATSGEMNSVTTPLYPFSGCGGGALERPFTEGGSADGIFMDDLAASMMYADAEDIHCPLEGSGPGTELPDGFYSPTEGGPGGGGGDYATTQSVSDMPSAQSAEWMRKMQRGVTRLLMGVIPSLLAVMNAIIQLLFALALVLLFIALPLGLLLVFFTDTAAGVTGLARRMVSVLQTSWSSSLLLGILFVALLAASALGNVAAFVGLSVAGVLLTLFIIFIAVNAFMSSVQAVAQTVSLGSGIGAGAAKVALAGVTGGVGAVALNAVQASTKAGEMGLTYAVARRAGTSRRYALSTAAGRVGGVARVGELASALGMDNEVTDGIYTGRRGARSREGYRLTRRLAETDAGKPDGMTGLTMKEREEQRDLQWAAERARRGSQLEQAGRILSGTARAVRHPAQAALSGAQAVSPAVERIRALSGDTAHAAWERVRAAQDSVTERIGDAPAVISVATALAGAASHGFARDARSGRVARSGRGGLRYLPRLADPRIPSWSLRELVSDVKEGRLLQLGHHLQYNDDGSVTFWHPDGPALPKEVGATTPTPCRNDSDRRDARGPDATSGQQRTVDIADPSAGMTTAANGHPPRDSVPAVMAPMPPTAAVIPGDFLSATSSTAYPAPLRPGAPEAADSVLPYANASPLAPVMRPARRSRVYSVGDLAT